jgi:5-methylcytosine-specific restriction endonuclease McrA
MVKKCPSCGESLPIESFGIDKKRRDGKNVYCKSCIRIKSSESYFRTWEKSRERKSKYQKTDKGKEYGRRWYRQNKEMRDAQIKEYQKKHPERYREYAREWDKRNPEKRRAVYAKYRKSHPEKTREMNSRRKARIRNNKIGKVDYKKIIMRDGYICHICGNLVHPKDLQFDHVFPLSKGGSHTDDNISVSHALCNNKKRAKIVPPEELAYEIRKSPGNSGRSR